MTGNYFSSDLQADNMLIFLYNNMYVHSGPDKNVIAVCILPFKNPP